MHTEIDDPSTQAPPASFYYERHAQTIAAHLSERVDPEWGQRMTNTLRMDVENLAQSGQFRLNGVECRDSTCRVTVRWDKFGTARDTYSTLLHHPMQMACGRTLVIPEKQPDEPVEATMILDCAEWKANGSELLDLSSTGTLPLVMPGAP